MSKTPQQYAEELIEQHTFRCRECDYEFQALQSAKTDVRNTLDALNWVTRYTSNTGVAGATEYYQQVLTILETNSINQNL